ncbi:MAG: ATP-binding cassette domain-containing protein, partial [Bacillota bacterium]
METFKIQQLTYFYPMKDEPALKDVTLSVDEGEFILVLGRSGSGKSTLGRVFNRIVPEFYGGRIKGRITGTDEIGMVFQDPEKQLVMDCVERELAFGLENIGAQYGIMKKKVMETLSFMNIMDVRGKKTYELSGGQKQKVAIGAMLSMGYRFLVLDEPTSQLDPSSSEEIMHVIKRLNDELGYTVILIEQTIDRCFHLADRILFMDEGRLIFDGTPREFAAWENAGKTEFLPSVSGLFSKLGWTDVPLTVKEGRSKLRKLESLVTGEVKNQKCGSGDEAIRTDNLCFAYEDGPPVLKGLDMTIYKGEILGIMGENGGGKSTLLKTFSGLLSPVKGRVSVDGEVGYLSQEPNDYLFNDTVYDELKFTLDNNNIKDYSVIDVILEDLDISIYRDKNPRDLSSGEKQRVALASILVMDPDILLLDEPTRGLDRH